MLKDNQFFQIRHREIIPGFAGVQLMVVEIEPDGTQRFDDLMTMDKTITELPDAWEKFLAWIEEYLIGRLEMNRSR